MGKYELIKKELKYPTDIIERFEFKSLGEVNSDFLPKEGKNLIYKGESYKVVAEEHEVVDNNGQLEEKVKIIVELGPKRIARLF